MNHIQKNDVIDTLESCGFIKSPTNRSVFVVDKSKYLSPAYCMNVIRDKGLVRFGGALGLYFTSFEKIWTASIGPREKKIDATLPLVMLIDNFLPLINSEIFSYSDDLQKVGQDAKLLYRVARTFPQNIEEFDMALKHQEMFGKPLSEYLHIQEFNTSENLYYRKSDSFVRWFITEWPQYGQHLFACLNDRQKKRLGFGSAFGGH